MLLYNKVNYIYNLMKIGEICSNRKKDEITMNEDVNQYVRRLIELDNEMKTYRKSAEDDVQRYRERNEQKLALLNAHLKEAQDEGDRIKATRLSETQNMIDQKNALVQKKLDESQKKFDQNKNAVIDDIFNELFEI